MREPVKRAIEARRTVQFEFPDPKASAGPRPCSAERSGRLPRVTRLMALALKMQMLVQQGTVRDYADLARLGRVSPARITQVMNLLNLAPDIQEWVLFLNATHGRRIIISERRLRAVTKEPCWQDQREILAEAIPIQPGFKNTNL
jgi:hypothetical protein